MAPEEGYQGRLPHPHTCTHEHTPTRTHIHICRPIYHTYSVADLILGFYFQSTDLGSLEPSWLHLPCAGCTVSAYVPASLFYFLLFSKAFLSAHCLSGFLGHHSASHSRCLNRFTLAGAGPRTWHFRVQRRGIR